MSNEVNRSNTSSTGTNTITQAAGPGRVWNLSYLSVSVSGPRPDSVGKVTVYDGDTSGDQIFSAHLPTSIGSVGTIHEIALPKDGEGKAHLSASPGAAMTIVCEGTGAIETTVNARIGDGLPG